MRYSLLSLTALLLIVQAVFACSGSAEGGAPTGAKCGSDSELDYESFGKGFMDRYCVQCHSSQLPSGARNGAPLDHDFDSLAGIRATPPAHLEEVAAAGPEAVNRQMPPPGYPEPTDRERKQLGEWLACGAP